MTPLFKQGAPAAEGGQSGMGIGLHLVKTLAELHGGSVSARSEGPGRGAEFELRLPLAEARAGDTRVQQLLTGTSGLHILLIEDQQDTAELMASELRLRGHQVTVEYCGLEGLHRALSDPPQVVLLDIGLPDIDGFEIASRLRRELAAQQPLIVAITGYGRPQDMKRSTEAGIDYYLLKPYDNDALSAILLSYQRDKSCRPTLATS